VTLAILALRFRQRIASPTVRRLTVFFLCFIVAVMFLMLSPSTPIWEVLRLVSFAQFPWRLLVVVIVALAFVAGSVVAAEGDAVSRHAELSCDAGCRLSGQEQSYDLSLGVESEATSAPRTGDCFVAFQSPAKELPCHCEHSPEQREGAAKQSSDHSVEIASSPCGLLAMTPGDVAARISGIPRAVRRLAMTLGNVASPRAARTRHGRPRDDSQGDLACKPGPGLVVLVLLILIGSYPYLQAQIVEPAEGPVSLAGLMRFQQSANEMTGSTAWVEEIPQWSAIADHYIAGKKVASKIDFTASQETLEAAPIEVGTNYELVRYKTFTEPARLVFDIFYYPGWRAYSMKKNNVGYSIDRELKIEPYGKLGKISVEVDPKRRHVLVRFEDTPVRVAGKIISGFGLLLVLALLLGRWFICAFGLLGVCKPRSDQIEAPR